MNKRQKLVQQQFINNEEAVIKRLKTVYNKSLEDITAKSKALQDEINSIDALIGMTEDAEEIARLKSMEQSKIYQKQYQDAMKKQVNSILDNMQVEEFKTVSSYLQKCYEDGFIGTMYDLQGQGIPLCFPLDQEAMVRAVQLDSKISHGLYNRLGEDVALLKKKITAQVSRGIATGMTYQQVAQQLAGYTKIGFNNAVRIARTEGHRIQVQSGMDACYKAKSKGADVVKQWDATLDSSTRESHQQVDGEIRELDKPFSNGLMFPGDPSGAAAEVCNCRCALLQRARWALDEDELQTLQDRAEFYGLDKTKNFKEFKQKYLKAAENISTEELYEKHKDKINQALYQIESEATSLTDKEHGAILDAQGNVLWRSDGSAHSVQVDDDSLLNNAIFTHNHPGGGCFTAQDIESALKTNVYELRASTPDGKFFSLRRTGKADENIISDVREASSISAAGERVRQKVLDGTISKEEFAQKGFWLTIEEQSNMVDEFLQKNAEKYGFIYKTGKIDDLILTKSVKNDIIQSKFVPAKDLKEAARRMSDAVGVKDVSFGRMPQELANQYLEGTEKFMKDFPMLKGYYSKVGTKTGSPQYMGINKLSGEYIDNRTKMKVSCELHLKSTSNLEKMLADYAADAKRGGSYKNESPMSTAIHELVHGLDHAITLKKHGGFDENGLGIIASKDWSSATAGVSRKIVQQVRQEMFGAQYGKEVADATRYLGSYARTSSKEELAEAISYEYVNESNPYSARILELFKKEVEGVFGK